MPASPSIAQRALIAIALLVGFYVLAIGVAAVLLWIPYASYSNNFRLPIKIAFLCVAGAGIILWSILPRFDRFQVPGPILKQEDQPELFQAISEVAQATGEEMPREVYLISSVNAWVAQRGGILGIGSRRVMGLGLPLMQILKVTELRAVLAHEFGHYYGGDTKLGPVVYNMRSSIWRTVYNLARNDSYLYKLFDWYGEIALRLTQSVSRQQEHAADELAARTVGAKPLANALKAIHSGSLAFVPYLQQEVTPLLNLNVRPALASGFSQFLSSPRIGKAVSEEVAREIAEGKAKPFDSHPPLRERLAELERLTQGSPYENDHLAVSLLRQIDSLEADLLVFATGKIEIQSLRSISWDRVGPDVYLPNWRKLAKGSSAGLQRVRPIDFPKIASDLAGFGRELTPKSELPSREVLQQRAIETVGAAFAIALNDHGWILGADPGEPFHFVRDGARIEPFSILTRLNSGELKVEAWEQQCQEMGIAEWQLGYLKDESLSPKIQ